MSKVGRMVNGVTETMMYAGGKATQYTGEALGEVGKKMGIDSEKCDRMEMGADKLATNMYLRGNNVGNKMERATDKMVNQTKETFRNLSDKMKS